MYRKKRGKLVIRLASLPPLHPKHSQGENHALGIVPFIFTVGRFVLLTAITRILLHRLQHC